MSPAHRSNLLLAAIATIAVVALGIGISRHKGATAQAASARLLLKQTSHDVQQIIELRARHETIADRKRPDQDVIARVNAVLADAGIASSSFGGLQSEAESGIVYGSGNARSNVRRQAVRINLNQLTIAQIGEFLARWTATQPLWIPTRIELTHSREKDQAEHGRYTLTLVLSALYVSEENPS